MSGQTCLLCGRTDVDVRMALVRYAEEHRVNEQPFGALYRCKDAVECRARVEASGKDPWPLDDTTTMPTQVVAMRVGRRLTPDSQANVADKFVPVAAAVLNGEEVDFG